MKQNNPGERRKQLAVTLLRVSTDRQFQEGESIETQRRKVDFVALRENLDIVRYFTEHYSGQKSDRRVIDELFDFLKSNVDLRYVIIGDIDRFTRGGSEIYLQLKRRLRELNVALLDSTGVIQPERNRLEHLNVEYDWAIESPSRYAEVFMAEKAKSEASDILTRTIGQQIQLTRDGFQVRGANYGYKNAKISTEYGKKKTIMVADETEAPFILQMFELRAEAALTDHEICGKLNTVGYRSRPSNIFDQNTREIIGRRSGAKLTPKQLQKYLSRTIYCGVRCEGWNSSEPVRTPFDPLVSVELFNRANRGKVKVTIDPAGKIRIEEGRLEQLSHRHNPEFLLRHVVLCPLCAKPFTASKSKGKLGNYFGYFHCARKHRYFGVKQKEFENTVASSLNRLEAKPGFLDLFREVVCDVWMSKNSSQINETKQIQEHKTQLKERQANLLDKYVSCQSDIVQRKLQAQIEELEELIKATENQSKNVPITDGEIEAYFQIAKKMMEHPSEHILNAPTKPKLEKLWFFIFADMPTYQQLTDGTPELTLLYRFSQDPGLARERLAGQLSLQWNTFQQQVQNAVA